jgi:hypothetical protein
MPCDRESRQENLRNAIAITTMEGGKPSARCLEIMQAYVDGVITIGEADAMVMEHVTRPHTKESE